MPAWIYIHISIYVIISWCGRRRGRWREAGRTASSTDCWECSLNLYYIIMDTVVAVHLSIQSYLYSSLYSNGDSMDLIILEWDLSLNDYLITNEEEHVSIYKRDKRCHASDAVMKWTRRARDSVSSCWCILLGIVYILHRGMRIANTFQLR